MRRLSRETQRDMRQLVAVRGVWRPGRAQIAEEHVSRLRGCPRNPPRRYWRLSWGGASYTGPTTGNITNDNDGDFGPPYPGALPSSGAQALLFQGTAAAKSSSNAADYALTSGAATFTNNAGQSFQVVLPPKVPVASDLGFLLLVVAVLVTGFLMIHRRRPAVA